MRFQFIDVERAKYPVTLLCDVLEVSRSGYNAWRSRPGSARAQMDMRLALQIAGLHRKSRYRYGSPRIHRALRREGVRVGKKRVERLMRAHGLRARQRRASRRTTDSRHDQPIAPNLLARRFDPEAINRVWAGDVTYIATHEGFAYLAVLLDLYARRAVGWAISRHNDTELALAALRRAVRTRGALPSGIIHHTDRGSPYASDEYRKEVKSLGMQQSMSRKGDCWDNAVSESFFATLRAELTDLEDYPNAHQAEVSISEYIERFYNVERQHSYIDYASPIEFELKSISKARPAAA